MNENVCSSCGSPFNSGSRKPAFSHPNLFGGVDRFCGPCFRRMEEARIKRMGKPVSTRKREKARNSE